MSLIVQKFGGSSVANAERVNNVASIIADTYRSGHDVVVVVSAQGDTTDDLIEKAKEINPNASKREMDMLLSAGEQISISLLAMAIEKLGLPVCSLLGWQVGVHTDAIYSNARIRSVDTERMTAELSKHNILIVAGFQGINKFDDITTLGRGGSDTSAVALAVALKAEKCQIFTDVDGVYTADPRIVKNAKKQDEVNYNEMLELATLGAQVLHNRSVEMAQKYGVELEVLSSITKTKGTIIKENVEVEKTIIRGVAKDDNIARISIVGLEDVPGIAFKLFDRLAKKHVNVDIILQSVGRDGTKDITFTISRDQQEVALEVVNAFDPKAKVSCDNNISKVSIVGSGMETHPSVAAKMFEALYAADINIQMINTSEIRISVLIDINDSNKALKAVHDAFIK